MPIGWENTRASGFGDGRGAASTTRGFARLDGGEPKGNKGKRSSKGKTGGGHKVRQGGAGSGDRRDADRRKQSGFRAKGKLTKGEKRAAQFGRKPKEGKTDNFGRPIKT